MDAYALHQGWARPRKLPGIANGDEGSALKDNPEKIASDRADSITHELFNAAYLRTLPRPPFEDGMPDLDDVLFMGFLRGEIPADDRQQARIATICIDNDFPKALAWLIAKAGITALVYYHLDGEHPVRTLTAALQCSGLPLRTIECELPYLSAYDAEDLSYSLKGNHELKRLDLCKTPMHEVLRNYLHQVKGPNGNLIVTGGMIKDAPCDRIALPASALNQDALKSISRAQLNIQGNIAVSAVEAVRKIDFQKLSEVRLPDISRFPAQVQTALKHFFRKAYDTPYFMLHTTFSSNVPHILSSGSLTSRARLKAMPSKPRFRGLEDINDENNNAHHMVFASMGTRVETLQPPSDFRRVKLSGNPCSAFIMNLDLLIQHKHLSPHRMMVKSCDWGDQTPQVISIPNTAITITRLGMDALNGPIAEDALIRYRYQNGATGFSKEYALPVHGDIATGSNYRQLIPLLLVEHLAQLDRQEQHAILHGLSDEVDGSAMRNATAEGILQAFSTLEISVAGSLPLRLEYLDRMEHDGTVFDFKALRDAVQDGRLDDIIAFMRKHSDFAGYTTPKWLIEGICGIARDNWLTARAANEPGWHADRYLAILDHLEPALQNIAEQRLKGFKPVHTSHDLLKQLDDLNAVSIGPSQINLLVSELGRKQDAIESYLTENRARAVQTVESFRTLFVKVTDVSDIGLQSTLRVEVVEARAFHDFVADQENIKVLIYLAAATSALIDRVFGEIDFKVFESKNTFTGLNVVGKLDGINSNRMATKVNRSILSDLLANVPGTSLFVAANGKPGKKTRPEDGGKAVCTANSYRLLFGALRNVLRQHGLVDAPITTGEKLLLERYDAGKWPHYKERFSRLAGLSEGRTINDGGSERKYHRSANAVISSRSVFDGEYAHFNLDARHLQAILAGTYGDAKTDFDELVETIAAQPEADENHRVTAIQLFYRMKLLEFEFYKESLISEISADGRGKAATTEFDIYALSVLGSMDQR